MGIEAEFVKRYVTNLLNIYIYSERREYIYHNKISFKRAFRLIISSTNNGRPFFRIPVERLNDQ